MRGALNIILVKAGILVNVLMWRDTPVPNTQAATWSTQNTAIVHGLHVALPAHMKNFPPERVPLP
ncbi:MAG: hypothetical protein ACM3IH_06400 [Sphingobacteriales bacterium]